MRTILVGLAGLALVACGEGEGADQKTYGAKPSERDTVELAAGEGEDTPDNQEITGTPTGMSGGPEGGSEGALSDGSMTHNQSQPMQAAQ